MNMVKKTFIITKGLFLIILKYLFFGFILFCILHATKGKLDTSLSRAENGYVMEYDLAPGETEILPVAHVIAETSDPNIAVVDENGVIKAVTDGSCYISYRNGKFPLNILDRDYRSVKVNVSSSYSEEGTISVGYRKFSADDISFMQESFRSMLQTEDNGSFTVPDIPDFSDPEAVYQKLEAMLEK